MALKRTRGRTMTPEGSVAEYLSPMRKKKTLRIPHSYKYTVPHEKEDSRI